MFGFMKKHSDKEKEEKEKKKKEKRDKKDKKRTDPKLSQEELNRLEDLKRGLLKQSGGGYGGAKPYPGTGSGDGVTPSDSMDSINSGDSGQVYTSSTRMSVSKTVKVPPPTQPKPKKGILKDKSSYGPEVPNQGVRGNLDDTMTLEENTNLNEDLFIQREEARKTAELKRAKEASESQRQRSVKSIVGDFSHAQSSSQAQRKPAPSLAVPHKPNFSSKPRQQAQSVPKINTELAQDSQSPNNVHNGQQAAPQQSVSPVSQEPASPSDKTYSHINLHLPDVAPPKCPKPRQIVLKRQPAGDFGFTLRRGVVLERGADNSECKRTVIFAEPGPKNLGTGLLPGDRLIEVNNINVEQKSREEIIEIIKSSTHEVVLKVQPIPELSELSMRSGLEGEDVPLTKLGVQGGTLQRSGSMRYKSRQGRSDDQLHAEKTWLKAERVWLIHKGGFAAAKMLKSGETGAGDIGEGKCRVKLEFGGEELEVDEEDVEKANPPQFDRVEDLATLRYLNESSLLHTLRQRYGSNLIHTYAGQSLLVLNPMHPLSIYSEKVINMFKGCKPEDMPPHVYATSQIALRSMLSSRHDQSVVFLGRSGSGKTTNARNVIQYLLVTAGSVNNFLSTERLTAVFTLLDGFGNSRTLLNTNATRFTAMFSLDFDHTGMIGNASVQVLMLEKNRVAKRPEGEPTFHVCYQLLAGLEPALRKELLLDNLNEPNLFMTPLQRAEDRTRAGQDFVKITNAMQVLNMSEADMKAIFSVIAAIYHLGVAGTVKGQTQKYQFARPAAAQKAAQVLGMTPEELSRAIFSPPQQIRGNSLRPGSSPGDKQSPPEVLTGMEALEGFVIGLYNEAFHALVSLINRALSTNFRTTTSILIVDMPGFQNPASCGRQSGASFEDLCHNYTQERLQLLFHELVFTCQQDLYSQENIECDFEPVSSSPAPMVALIDKPSQQSLMRSAGGGQNLKDTDQRGLLWLLDEEAILPGASDESFMERIIQHHGGRADKLLVVRGRRKGDSLLKKTSHHSFVLSHFQGTNPVQYNTRGWLKLARENAIARTVNTILQDSHKPELSQLFSTVRGPGAATTVSGSVVGIEGASSLRRVSSMRRTFTSGSAGLKRKSICLQVKFQVDSIIDTLRRTKVHFVHCLLPQHNAGLSNLRTSQLAPNKAAPSEDIMLNVPLVRSQVRGAELVEAIRIHRQGFPDHMQFTEFRRRFEVLVSPEHRPAPGTIVDEKQAVESFLEHLEIDKTTYRLGLSQVFFRTGALSQLEDLRDEKITGQVVSLQARCRGYIGRQKLKKLKLQHLAVSCIQRNVRKYMAIQHWSWWRLYTKVQPLLNVHKTEEELRDREIELEQMKLKIDKLEKERTDYKNASDRLETKLNEITADLAEEHTTSNQATEVLESEQAERIRLERELKDITSKFLTLQRKHEQTELDLYDARMLAASLDEELEAEDDESGGIYRERYERCRRELEFTKKKLQQRNDEDMEQHSVIKKQQDRKYHEALEEVDDQKRQVSNLKKKIQRVNQEHSDTRRHLEEQVSRNTDLEKKQRKFDSELNKVTESMRHEKLLREKLQRERDELAGDKYTIEQELKSLQVDMELQTEKVARLERELQDMSDVSRDDKEVMHMKRMKNELERKVLDQEEELDEQAGTIQQLEQAKLRLEMAQENSRQQHMKELEEKENELEDLRASSHKKLKSMEAQMEEEYENNKNIAKEKRELERKMKELSEMTPSRDRDVEKRLRRDLKRTKALLQDAHVMIDKQKENAGGRGVVKQLRNQLEDAEYAASAAMKARKGVEMEVQELQAQLDSVAKSKQDADERCTLLAREKNDLMSRIEDNEEDVAEIMKKYNAAVKQQSADIIIIQDQSRQIEELHKENQSLKEQISSLESRIEYYDTSTVDKEALRRLELKIRELDSKVEFEKTAKLRAESIVSRLKEQVESLTAEKEHACAEELRHKESSKRHERQLRDLQELHGELERKEAETSQHKENMERKISSMENDYEQCQSDLRLAFKRISDLQGVIEDEMDSADDSELGSDELDMLDSESDSDDDLSLVSGDMPTSRSIRLSSIDGSVSGYSAMPSADMHYEPIAINESES